MKSCRLQPASFGKAMVVAGLLNLLSIISLAQAQTTTAPSEEPPAKTVPAVKSPAKKPAKGVSELPPPEPEGESPLVTPERNPFPTSGLGLQIEPAKEEAEPDAEAELGQEPGYFGAITDDRQKLPGVRIVEVVPGGPAAQAGLLAGDLITSVDDQPIREMADLAKIFTASQVGQQLKIVYQRGASLNTPGQSATLDVTLGARPVEKARRYAQFGRIDEEAMPQQEAERPSGMLLGVRTAPLDMAMQRRLGVTIQSGAVVLEVTPGSPAARAGIPRDAVIVSINGLLIDSPDALTREILQAGPGAEVELGYYLGRNLIRRHLVIGGGPQRPVSGGNVLGHDAAMRIEQLEQQVQELHRRIEQLEAQLQK